MQVNSRYIQATLLPEHTPSATERELWRTQKRRRHGHMNSPLQVDLGRRFISPHIPGPSLEPPSSTDHGHGVPVCFYS